MTGELHARTWNKKKKKERERERKWERKKREKRQRTGVSGACAGYPRRWGILSQRGVATPGVVSSAACAVILARNSSSSRACICSPRCRTSRVYRATIFPFYFILSFFTFTKQRRSRKIFRQNLRLIRCTETHALRIQDFEIDRGINRRNRVPEEPINRSSGIVMEKSVLGHSTG